MPLLITNILKKWGFKENITEIQRLKYDIVVYPRDYFYPLSDNHRDNIFTDNTCMIHYYDASWIPKSEYIRFKVERIFGKKIGGFILNILINLKKLLKGSK